MTFSFLRNKKEPGHGPKLIFLRWMECSCASDSALNATMVDEEFCTYPGCPVGEPIGEGPGGFGCGGDTVYTVFCVTSSTNTDECRDIIGQQYPFDIKYSDDGSGKFDPGPFPVPHISCGLCESSSVDLCAPFHLSPYFYHFPWNNPEVCALFCHRAMSYAVWDTELENAIVTERPSTLYAILVWWRVPDLFYEIAFPVCLCGDESVKNKFLTPSPDKCDEHKCVRGDNCGGVDADSVYGSVYCIEDGSGRCNEDLSPSTTIDTMTTTVQGTESTGEPDPVATDESEPSTIGMSTTEYSTTTVETMPTPETSTSGQTTKGTSQETTTALTTVTPKPPPISGPKCSRKDRYGILWESGVNMKASKDCSELIPGSTGKAYWKCGAGGEFETRQPNVTECRSGWVKEMEEKFDGIEDVDDASDYTSSLSAGCSDQRWDSKYFGMEMFWLITSAIKTLQNVKTFQRAPSEDEYVDLVSDTVDLSACLINSPDPWEDLRMENKSRLYTYIVEATDDALFQLSQYVKSKKDYRKDFVPMKQFTAAAEAFENVRNKSDKYPPQCAPDGKSCIRLPPGWTDIFPEKRVHVAVITTAPQSVAAAMTGKGVYEVNGENGKLLNGRIMSLSVTSSSSPESKSLQFHGKGVETTFRHITDAHGEAAYEIRRKLHEGEIPKAVLGGSQCVFWDTKKNIWSGKGCHLVKIGRTETTCECSHLTAFAILMKVHSYTGKQRGLEILTLVLCPLSELGLLLTIVILSKTKKCLCKVRSTICKNLSLCLLLGNGMILTVLDRNNFRLTPGIFIGAAIAGHYILLCAFMWMLLEGVQLYRAVVQVFDSGKSYMKHLEWLLM